MPSNVVRLQIRYMKGGGEEKEGKGGGKAEEGTQ